METVSPNRVYQADAVEFLQRLPDHSVDLICIDPPYGNDNGNDLAGNRAKKRVRKGRSRGAITPIANDDPQSWAALMPRVLAEARRVLKPVGACVVMCAGGGPKTPYVDLIGWMQLHLVFDHLGVWDKSKQGPGMGMKYRRTSEFFVIGHPQKGRLKWAEGRSARPDVLHFAPIQFAKQANGRAKYHENEKPVDLMNEFILNHTNTGDTVVDCFCGSGTTLVAAQALGRIFYGCDVDAGHVEMARNRLGWGTARDMFPNFGSATLYETLISGLTAEQRQQLRESTFRNAKGAQQRLLEMI